jgi:hypothetical protein
MTRHDVADESDIENAPFYGQIQEPATPENVRALTILPCIDAAAAVRSGSRSVVLQYCTLPTLPLYKDLGTVQRYLVNTSATRSSRPTPRIIHSQLKDSIVQSGLTGWKVRRSLTSGGFALVFLEHGGTLDGVWPFLVFFFCFVDELDEPTRFCQINVSFTVASLLYSWHTLGRNLDFCCVRT